MFVFSKQEKIVLLLIVTVIITIFGCRFYLQEKNKITILPSNQENLSIQQNVADTSQEEIYIIHIAGAVKQPGVYQISSGERIIDVVKMAGGALEKAHLDMVNLAAPIHDGQKIIIPFIPEERKDELSGMAEQGLTMPEFNYDANSGLININSATARELESLPGIGPVLAERILEFRKNNGIFRRIEDIKGVSGIGQKRFDAIKEMITTH
jgi:competence protein ComEA